MTQLKEKLLLLIRKYPNIRFVDIVSIHETTPVILLENTTDSIRGRPCRLSKESYRKEGRIKTRVDNPSPLVIDVINAAWRELNPSFLDNLFRVNPLQATPSIILVPESIFDLIYATLGPMYFARKLTEVP